ncbi:hypothetical protein [Legionella spiritensis]|uniref:Dot/Icm system substrate protein LidA n=1 Tax=Legionella spiritensis TaxID=452 RepID=A0A0W0ZAS5_LEGSP|nr:hypothetical protein [Legionella spiritensis]KTD66252.1 Dot/Icm system substrate protein LidA [Legionella spiritensis]SNV48342.1 Dot/Icm system substrate protein LidA [Legionella spiritensis]
MPSKSENTEQEVGTSGLQTEAAATKFFKSKHGQQFLSQVVEVIEEKEQEKQAAILWQQQEELKAAAILTASQEDTVVVRPLDETEVVLSEPQENNIPEEPDTSTYDAMMKGFNKNMEALEEHRQQIEQRYEDYNDNLKQADDFIDTLPTDNKDDAIQKIEDKIKELEANNDKDAQRIYGLVDEGKENEARDELQKLNAKNLQVGTLKDMLSVVKGEKSLYTAEGEKIDLNDTNVVDAFKESGFIVPDGQKIVTETNEETGEKEFFLLGEDDELTDENKESAKDAFDRKKPELSSVKSLVGDMKDKELTSIRDEISKLQTSANESAPVAKSEQTAAPAPAAPSKKSGKEADTDGPPKTGEDEEKKEEDLYDKFMALIKTIERIADEQFDKLLDKILNAMSGKSRGDTPEIVMDPQNNTEDLLETDELEPEEPKPEFAAITDNTNTQQHKESLEGYHALAIENNEKNNPSSGAPLQITDGNEIEPEDTNSVTSKV